MFTSTGCKLHEGKGFVCFAHSHTPKAGHRAGVSKCKHEYVLRGLSMMTWWMYYLPWKIIENSGREKKWFGRKTSKFTVDYK